MSATPMKFENVEWENLQRLSSTGLCRHDVTVTLVKKAINRAHAVAWFRRDAGAWIKSNGPRFNVQIGGANANLLRVIPDAPGQFSAFDFKGVQKLTLSIINVWPDEARRSTGARYEITPDGLVVILPDDFAQPQAAAIAEDMPMRPAAAADSFTTAIGGVVISMEEKAALDVLLKNSAGDGSQGMSADMICRLSAKIKPLGISIQSVFGGGFRLDAGSKARLRIFLEKTGASAA